MAIQTRPRCSVTANDDGVLHVKEWDEYYDDQTDKVTGQSDPHRRVVYPDADTANETALVKDVAVGRVHSTARRQAFAAKRAAAAARRGQ